MTFLTRFFRGIMKYFTLFIISIVLSSCVLSLPEANTSNVIKDANSAVKWRADYATKANLPLEYKNDFGMRFSLVPPGTYMVGSALTEPNRQKKETPHLVTITKAYYIGVTEVTQAEWMQVIEENPSKFIGNDLPVDQVMYEDALEYSKVLSTTGNLKYRLPTEAEWEIACRAGTTESYGGVGDLKEMGWYCDNSESKTHPVGTKKPNHFGIYDMHGNVWEWTSDVSGEYPAGNLTDPRTLSGGGGNHVKRGGSSVTSGSICRSAYRYLYAPMVHRHTNTGFRLVFQADQLKPR